LATSAVYRAERLGGMSERNRWIGKDGAYAASG